MSEFKMEDVTWKLANDPPKAKIGCWSHYVIVVTNYGDVHEIAYFGTETDGVWQRPFKFAEGEKVVKWIEKP